MRPAALLACCRAASSAAADTELRRGTALVGVLLGLVGDLERIALSLFSPGFVLGARRWAR